MARPEAIILDFDGVIVQSLDLHLEAWAAAVEATFGVKLEDPGSLAGHATRTIAHILCRQYGDAAQVKQLVLAKVKWLAERYALLPLVPGARELVEECARLSLALGVASNSPGAFVKPALDRLKLSVPIVVCGDEVPRGKPHPAIFWECANRLGVNPDRRPGVLVFEDSAHGIKAANAAGMVAIGVSTEQSPSILLDAGARVVVATLAEALTRGWTTDVPG